jgi:hypothetical protein
MQVDVSWEVSDAATGRLVYRARTQGVHRQAEAAPAMPTHEALRQAMARSIDALLQGPGLATLPRAL